MKRAAILAILALIPALAQAQWSARLSYPSSLSLKLENLWSLTITNQATAVTEVMLHAEVNEQTRGLQFKGTTNKISIPSWRNGMSSIWWRSFRRGLRVSLSRAVSEVVSEGTLTPFLPIP